MDNTEEYNSFSQRIGAKPVNKEIQIESIDQDLKNSLWNCVNMIVLQNLSIHSRRGKSDFVKFVEELWFHFFKEPIENIPRYARGGINKSKTNAHLKSWFNRASWNETYDFIEIVAKLNSSINREQFIEVCNSVLKKENSGYRFVNGLLAPITNLHEIEEIDKAVSATSFTRLNSVNTHLQEALNKISDKENPDYRNSIKESISAVESLACIITENEGASLGEALNEITNSIKMHGALISGFKKLYGYTSDSDGIRHKLTEESNLDLEDARYMLISCSSFINYLISKAQKAGLNLQS